MLIWKLAEELAARGVPVTHEHTAGQWLRIDVAQAQITIEPRPHYCDRGNFIVKVFPRGDLALSLDEQDGFPRYYFGVQACADEVREWIRVRCLLPFRAPLEPERRELIFGERPWIRHDRPEDSRG
jgi:hypothetical protein